MKSNKIQQQRKLTMAFVQSTCLSGGLSSFSSSQFVTPVNKSTSSSFTVARITPPHFPISCHADRQLPDLATAESVSRRNFLATAAMFAVVTISSPTQSKAAAINPAKEPLLAIVQSVNMLKPVEGYITEGAWDKARTNINFCTRQLRLRTSMKKVADSLEGDGYYEGIDMIGDLDNILTQLDASVYTPIFIPADAGEIPPEAKKYQKQAFGYLEQALALLGNFLALCPKDEVQAAIEKADKNPVRFKDYMSN